MKIERIVTPLFFMCVALTAQAQRKPLDPPSLVQFKPEEHFTEKYRNSLQALGECVKRFDSERLRALCGVFYRTLDQAELVDAVTEIIAGLPGYKSGPASGADAAGERAKLLAAANAVKDVLESSAYVAGVPLDVRVNQEMRRYEIRWKELKDFKFSGKEVLRTVPFVPRMRIVVSAFYDPQKGGGSYGYRIANEKESETFIIEFEVECQGLTEERDAEIQNRGRRLIVRSEAKMYWMALPARLMQNFMLATFDKSDMGVKANPGENLEYPAMLSVPWKHLPGVVACWVSAGHYRPFLDVEMVSQNVILTFSTRRTIETPGLGIGKKTEPRYAYWGKTIGPVPTPEADVPRGKFLERIIGYLNEAEAWGWTASKAATGEIRKRLLSLRGSDCDPAQIAKTIDYVEQARRQGEILEEAFVLLKYNLSYLADRANWKNTP